jgi:Zn-dependent protease with chaperone function
MGIPMSAVITPLVLAALLLLSDLVYLMAPGLDPLGLLAAFDGVRSGPLTDLQAALVLAAVLLLPGSLVMASAWLGIRTLFRRAGPEALVRALGGRPPRPDDLEELQLQNVVAEMAIAAGLKPPRLMLLDGPVANAAAAGSSHEDAVVLVSRRMLDELDRDETQGVVAHLIGAIGNGDLRVSLSMLSLFRSVSLVLSALSATLGPGARRTFLALVRHAFRRPAGGAHDDDIARLDALLAEAAESHDRDMDQLQRKGTGLADLIRFPFMIAHLAIWLSRLAFVSFVVGPLLALVWRSRRYLADSSAVQLTRNPDSVARGLAALFARGGGVPDAGWAAPLFVVGPRPGSTAPLRASSARSAIMGDDFGWLSSDPPMQRRMARLRRQGASVDLARPPGQLSPSVRLAMAAFMLPIGVALVGCSLAISYVALAIDMLLLGPAVMALHALLRGWLWN